MEVAEKCKKCSAAFGKLDAQVCGRCGWDSQIDMRKCVKCKSAVVIHEKLGYGPLAGASGVTFFVLWRIFGIFFGGAIASLLAGACGILTALTLSYACSDCGKKPEARFLDADEKEDFKKRRLGFLIGGAGLGVLGVVLLISGVAIFNARMSGR